MSQGLTISDYNRASQLAYMRDAKKKEEEASLSMFQSTLPQGVAADAAAKDYKEFQRYESNAKLGNTVMGAGAGLALGCVAQNFFDEDSKLGQWMPLIGAAVGGLCGDSLFGASTEQRMADFNNNGGKGGIMDVFF